MPGYRVDSNHTVKGAGRLRSEPGRRASCCGSAFFRNSAKETHTVCRDTAPNRPALPAGKALPRDRRTYRKKDSHGGIHRVFGKLPKRPPSPDLPAAEKRKRFWPTRSRGDIFKALQLFKVKMLGGSVCGLRPVSVRAGFVFPVVRRRNNLCSSVSCGLVQKSVGNMVL